MSDDEYGFTDYGEYFGTEEDHLYEEQYSSLCSESNMERSRFKVLKELATGAFGKADLAYDSIEKKKVILKTMRGKKRAIIAKSEILLTREAWKYCPKHTVDLYGWFCYKEDDLYHITMVLEYVDGYTFTDILQDNLWAEVGMTEDQAVVKLLEALICLKKGRIYHGDVHFGNIMVSKQGEVKLIDYGRAKGFDSYTEDDMQQVLEFFRASELYGAVWDEFPDKMTEKYGENLTLELMLKEARFIAFKNKFAELKAKYKIREETAYSCIKRTADKHETGFEDVLKCLA